MHTHINALLISDALFSTDLERLAVIRTTALPDERIHRCTSDDLQRFLSAVGRLTDEVAS